MLLLGCSEPRATAFASVLASEWAGFVGGAYEAITLVRVRFGKEAGTGANIEFYEVSHEN